MRASDQEARISGARAFLKLRFLLELARPFAHGHGHGHGYRREFFSEL